MAKCKELKAQGGVRPAPASCRRRTFRAPTSGIAPLSRGKMRDLSTMVRQPAGKALKQQYWSSPGRAKKNQFLCLCASVVDFFISLLFSLFFLCFILLLSPAYISLPIDLYG
jgi:hypothetical protein